MLALEGGWKKFWDSQSQRFKKTVRNVANRIELGQIRAGLVVSCESAREIVDLTIDRLLRERSMETLRKTVATLTGGSGAVAVVLTMASRASAA